MGRGDARDDAGGDASSAWADTLTFDAHDLIVGGCGGDTQKLCPPSEKLSFVGLGLALGVGEDFVPRVCDGKQCR